VVGYVVVWMGWTRVEVHVRCCCSDDTLENLIGCQHQMQANVKM